MKKYVLIFVLILLALGGGVAALYFPSIRTVKIDAALTSGVSGQVLLGPTCPVMRNPPDPGCADKPYQTAIQVIESGTTRNSPFAMGQSGTDGKYKIMLPPGHYMVQAVGKGMLPRCEAKDVTIVANTITELDLSCDTGIR